MKSESHSFLTNRRLAWLIGLAVFLALFTWFLADNFTLTEVRLFSKTFQVRLAWALVVSVLVGALFGGGVVRLRRR